ncbi:MAG: GTPase HflX [Gammaproteobacteria bacterium]|nr:MAG: GTPase HflX [Gammaproteobacteria bacterium]
MTQTDSLTRPDRGERALLVHIDEYRNTDQTSPEEFFELAESSGIECQEKIHIRLNHPHPKYFIGSGKANEIAERARTLDTEVVIFSRGLSPAQERNLEQLMHVRVLDFNTLILDIFSQRARSFEGKIQVELAQLRHLSTRLIRGWTHLERQKGGIGLRGPGETQLETDRRLIGVRIKQLNRRLEKIRKQRTQARRSRQRHSVPVISLVGYTNAGKSTLFNQLTGSRIYAADQLFATLDPTTRKITRMQRPGPLIVDTVGFIRQLPHDLVVAFHATLEEVADADLLLHVIDVSHPEHRMQIEQVDRVLEEIGADHVPQIEVYNKIDCLEGQEARIDTDPHNQRMRAWISAEHNLGIDSLLQIVNTELEKRLPGEESVTG